MNDLSSETLIALRDAVDVLPHRSGRKIHISTVYRWVLKGARGKVLESVIIGGVRYTSMEALSRFISTDNKDPLERGRFSKIREQLDRTGLSAR